MFDFNLKPKQNETHTVVKEKKGVLFFIGKWVRRLCTTLGAIILLSSLSGCVFGFLLPKVEKSLPEKIVLVLKLSDGLSDTSDASPFSDPFAPAALSVHEIIETLHHASKDDRVKGVVASLPPASFQLAHVQELRKAVKDFKASGKFTKIYSPNYGEYGDGLSRYYLASAFEEIWMQPVGTVMISGLSGEQPFFRTALESIGVKPEILQRKEYKSALENFTNSQMSPANREMTESMLNDLMRQIVADVAKDRTLSEEAVWASVNKGILLGSEALEAKLITRLDYGDKILRETRKTITGDEEADDDLFVRIDDYKNANISMPASKIKQKIALIHVSGEIAPTAGHASPLSGGQDGLGADEISAALFDVAEDDEIKGVILRVNSPGGSPSASETIRNAVLRVKSKGKFVLVSMGPLAASGGYWIVANADEIFALPATLTGSIGVVGGKADLSGLWEKLSVTWEGPKAGANADILSFNKPLGEAGSERLNAMMDDIYINFTRIVAQGRKLDPQAVELIARGRVWTGAQAKDIGLVDQIGGYEDALASAAKRLSLVSVDELEVIVMPEPEPLYEKILSFLEQQSAATIALGKFSNVLLGKSKTSVMVYDPSLEFMQ